MRPEINIYCDESCHVQNDHQGAMVLGALSCQKDFVAEVSLKISELKKKHGFASWAELKWVKISPANHEMYAELLQLFADTPALSYRAIVIPDKGVLDHESFGQSHDDWYYKMYYNTLKTVLLEGPAYNIYLDYKDTKSRQQTVRLKNFLERSRPDLGAMAIAKVQTIRSHESGLLQLADVLTGLVCYKARNLESSAAKLSLIEKFATTLPGVSLERSSSYSSRKFNLLLWTPKKQD